MPFSSLKDPADVARAHGALERAWKQIAALYPEPVDAAAQRERLAYIVASYALIAATERELVDRAIARFRDTA